MNSNVSGLKITTFEASRYIGSIDYLFAILGLRWYAKKRHQRLANLFIFSINLIIAFYVLSVSVYKVPLKPKNLFNQNYVTYNFMLIVSLV